MKLISKKRDCSNLWIVIFIALIYTLLQDYTISAQREGSDKPSIRERLFYGGSMGLAFGSITDIQLAPVVGFWVLPRLSVAIDPDYRFYKDSNGRTDIYGGSAYTQIVVIQDLNNVIPVGMHYGIFLQAENELLSLESLYWKMPPVNSERFFVNTPMAGVGISQPIGKRASLNITVLWTLDTPQYDIYSDPEFRISFTF
ncbi:MAG: hypothetical protein ABSA76_09340 [Bacteroidales bacterium]